VLAAKLLPGGAINVIFALRKVAHHLNKPQHLTKDKKFKKVTAILGMLVANELRPANALHFYDCLSTAMRDERRVHAAALRPSFVELFRAVHQKLGEFVDADEESRAVVGSNGGGFAGGVAGVAGVGAGAGAGDGACAGAGTFCASLSTPLSVTTHHSMAADVAMWVNSAVSYNLLVSTPGEPDVHTFERCWPCIRSAAAMAAWATARRGAPIAMLIARLYDVLSCVYPLFKHVGVRTHILTVYAVALRSAKKKVAFEKHQRKELETSHSTMLARQ
jgi:hypothetical protein